MIEYKLKKIVREIVVLKIDSWNLVEVETNE
jgi:hypothetical protein